MFRPAAAGSDPDDGGVVEPDGRADPEDGSRTGTGDHPDPGDGSADAADTDPDEDDRPDPDGPDRAADTQVTMEDF